MGDRVLGVGRVKESAFVSNLKPLLITLVSGAILLYFVKLDLSQCLHYLARVDVELFLITLIIFTVRAVIRAVRFRYLLSEAPVLRRLSLIFILYQFFATVIPFKIGELALPVLLKQEGVPMAKSLAVMMLARVLDLAILAGYLLLLGQLFQPLWPTFFQEAWPLLAPVLWAILVVSLLVVVARSWFLRVLGRLLNSSFGRLLPRQVWIQERWEVFQDGLRDIGKGNLYKIIVLSLLLQIQSVVMSILMVYWLEPSISILKIIIGEVLLAVSNLIPLQGIAALGTFQGYFVMIFANFGLSHDNALALSIVIHALQLTIIIITGVAGWWLMGKPVVGNLKTGKPNGSVDTAI